MLFVISTTFAAGLSGYFTATTSEESIRAAQRAELDLSLASVPSLLRPVGERLLAPSLFYCREYRIELSATALSLRCDQRDPILRPMDGSTTIIPYDGKELQSRAWMEGEALLLTLGSDTGTRSSRFTPTATGMDLRVQVASARLDRPISWEISYQRKP